MSSESKIPGLYGQENVPLENHIIHQRYRIESIGFYWLIAEIDPEELLAFGYANLNNDDFAEWGYISIDELLENGAELDKEWKPSTFKVAFQEYRKIKLLN